MNEKEARAREMFHAGESVNRVATTLGITWQAAKKIQNEMGIATLVKKRGPGRRKAAAKVEEQESDEVPAAWDISLNVPTDRMKDIFAEFTPQEQADAIGAVLQGRLNAALTAGD